nr:DUF559 domain-containing protein [Helicobacter sp. 15-1451]
MKEFSREMRKNPTEAEKKLWQELRNKKLGFGFRRQFVIDSKYIADFVCLEKRLIIECDGGQHSESFEDKERDFYLESQNFRILRFWNNEILGNMEGVLEWIKEALENPTHPLTPSAKGGGIIEIPTQKKEGMSEEASAKEEGIDKQSFTNNKELGSLDQSSHSPCGRGWGGENIVEQYRYLPIDTKHFSKETRYKILSSFEDLESLLNGELIKSDNFQALNSIMPKYKGKIDLIYIDPPYNAPASEIIYKNNFKDSTWLSMMENRLSLAKEFLSKRGILSCAIDENEQENLGLLLGDIFYDYKKTCVSVVHNHGGIQGDNFSYSHEYAYFLYPIIKDLLNREKREDANIVALRDWGNGGSERHTAKNCFYPIYVKDSQIVGFGEVCKDDFHPPANVMREDGVIEVYPIDDEGVERKWRNAKNTIESIQDKLICKCIKGIFSIHRIKDEFRFKTCWYDKKYNANSYGSNILTNILPNNEFDYPKSIHTVKDSIYLASKEDSIVMDFFGGSGTTAHAVLELNKESGNRKFVLVEQGEHFYNVIIPRIKKVAFSSEWKNGELKDNKQVNPCSIAFAYYELESYEEALENCEYVLSENLPSSFAEREGESPRHCEQSEAIQKQSQIQNMDCHEVVPTSRNDKAKIIDYRKSRKLIKELDKGETINLDMSGEYRKKFDIFQTLANLMGWKIKRLFLDSKGVESCEYDNGEIVSIDKLDLQKYPRLKNLIWWE